MHRPFVTFGRLDVLVDNAGTAIPKPFMDTTLEEMDRVIDLNLRGVFIATHAALKQMLAGGRIITIGALRGTPGLVAILRARVKMFTQPWPVRSTPAASPSTNPANRYRSESCLGRMGCASNCKHGAKAVRPCG